MKKCSERAFFQSPQLKVSRKAQVAIFLILAAIILFGGIYFFSTKTSLGKQQVKVPKDFEPFVSFVDSCIAQSTEDGLQLIGFTGGYTEIPGSILNNPRAHLPGPDANFAIPYWWFDGKSGVPGESFIIQQLEQHIEKSSLECLNNFIDINNEFDVVPQGEIKAEVQLNEEDVSVEVSYELEAYSKLKDKKFRIENFFYSSPTRLRKAYELAAKIMERENRDFFIEEKTIDLMALAPEYDEKNPENSIPLTDTVLFDCGTKEWRISSIRNRLGELLVTNLPYIKVVGTDINLESYVPNPCTMKQYRGHAICENAAQDSTYKNSYFNHHYTWDLGPDSRNRYSDMEVSFSYNNWPIELNARPNEQGVLKSNAQKGIDLLKFLCINTWHFTYDVSYPLMVSIFDKPSENNKPYLFNFPFKVSIKSNRPDRQTTGTVLFEGIDRISNDEYCNELSREVTTIYTWDSGNNPVEDVELEYTCGKFVCEIGKTKLTEQGGAASISKRFPYCVLGVLRAEKESHKETSMFIQTDNRHNVYNVELNATKDFGKCEDGKCTSFKVVKTRLKRPTVTKGGSLESATAKLTESNKGIFWFEDDFKDLEENEKALLTIEDTKSSHETIGVYPIESEEPLRIGEETTRINEESMISLLRDYDTSYKVTVYLVNNEDNSITGGYEGIWQATGNNIQEHDEIVFYAIEFDPVSQDKEEQQEEMSVFISNIGFFTEKLNKQPELR